VKWRGKYGGAPTIRGEAQRGPMRPKSQQAIPGRLWGGPQRDCFVTAGVGFPAQEVCTGGAGRVKAGTSTWMTHAAESGITALSGQAV